MTAYIWQNFRFIFPQMFLLKEVSCCSLEGYWQSIPNLFEMETIRLSLQMSNWSFCIERYIGVFPLIPLLVRFFQFMLFLGKMAKMLGSVPNLWEILDPSVEIFVNRSTFQVQFPVIVRMFEKQWLEHGRGSGVVRIPQIRQCMWIAVCGESRAAITASKRPGGQWGTCLKLHWEIVRSFPHVHMKAMRSFRFRSHWTFSDSDSKL